MYQTRKESVISVLRERGDKGATGMDMLLAGGGMDWRKRVSELRRDGYNIVDKLDKRGKQHKRYFMLENR